jgi:hypothetical protein
MIEVQDIFREYSATYRKNNYVSIEQSKAIYSIENCRTESLGGHIDVCDCCGHTNISYNSCRNRHCPKCQGLAKEKWIYERQQDILPVKYFHVVFTIPEELYFLCYQNQREIYSLLFRASSETLLELSKDRRYIGAQIGFISILHTWGQNLMFHPHIHCIVTGGGLDDDRNQWRNSKNNFFIPVKVMSKKFRGKFLCYLKEKYYNGDLKLEGKNTELNEDYIFSQLVDKLFKKNWVVYCKKPFNDENCVINYLGRYTHRVAISNSRIQSLEGGKVTFKWKDYKDNNKNKLMTLDALEFIRRFLLHILPQRFIKIRYYGILSNRNRNLKLAKCKRIFKIFRNKKIKLTNAELFKMLTGREIDKCSKCKEGRLIPLCTMHPKSYKPPGLMENLIAN